MDYIRTLQELNKDDTAIAGGKGASLGEMTQAGIPVPPGFVVLADAFQQFLDEADLAHEIDSILHTVDTTKMHTVEDASARIQELILHAAMPPQIMEEVTRSFASLGAAYVAVRSSATAEDSASAAWAGQLDSYLNTTEHTLLKDIQRCWASLFTPRAIFYRHEKHLHGQQISVAVVVQEMVTSDTSGIAFSVHPVTEDPNQLIIEAGFGLGEAVVSGQVTPDSYVVEKSPRRIIDSTVATQEKGLYRAAVGGNQWRPLGEQGKRRVLSDAQVLELTEHILCIEEHYGFPCDIEWAEAGGKFYIVQSRPITTLTPRPRKETGQPDLPDITLDPDTYTYSWGGTGISFLFQSMFYHGLAALPFFDSFCVSKDGDQKVYWSHGARRGAAAYGKTIFRNRADAEAHCADIHRQADALLRYRDVQNIDSHTIQAFVTDAKAFLCSYLTLDPEFTDELLTTTSDPELTQLLGTHKNELREKLNHIFFSDDAAMTHVLRLVSSATGMNIATLHHCSLEELLEICTAEHAAVTPERHTFLIVARDGAVKYSFDEHIIDVVHKRFAAHADIHDMYELQGMSVAKKGVYRGVVKKLRLDYATLDAEISRLNKEEDDFVLVADHTTPELVPIMQKSMAVVTDMGGMLSHAAITSRELNLPCVVGTTHAMRVFNDGDLVEVDANAGVVRIVKGTHGERASTDVILAHLNIIKHTSWHTDWSGPFPLIENSAAPHVYFDGLLEVFGISLTQFLITYKKGIATALLPQDEYEAIGVHLAKQLQDARAAEAFAAAFKHAADEVKPALHLSPEEFLEQIDAYSESYKIYGVYSVATKIVYDFLSHDTQTDIKECLEDARKYSETFYKENANAYMRALRTVAAKTSYAIDSLFMLTREELTLFLQTNVLPPERELEERHRHSVFYATQKECVIYYGKDAHAIEQALREVRSDTFDTLHGTVAYPGLVRGTCRVVHDYANAADLAEGEVLVTGMTDPEFVPLMKRAAAIVTDGGGMLSHAAIVSRELKKPCIIGTKVATQVLQDGDLVEVDADAGVVRKLSAISPEQVFVDPKEWEVEFQQRDESPAIIADLWLRALRDHWTQEASLPLVVPDYIFTSSNRGYVKSEHKRAILETFRVALESDDYAQYILDATDCRADELLETARGITQKVTEDTPPHELLRHWRTFEAALLPCIPWFYIPWYVVEENMVTDRVQTLLAKHTAAVEEITDMQNALMVLIFPTKELELQREQSAFGELVRIANTTRVFETDSAFTEKAHVYLSTFGWTRTYLLVPKEFETYDELVARVRDAADTTWLEEYERTEKEKRKHTQLADELLSILADDRELIAAIARAREYGWMLSSSVERGFMATGMLIPFYKYIANAIDVPYADWARFTPAEVTAALAGEHVLSPAMAQERRAGYFAHMHEGTIRFWHGTEGAERTRILDTAIDMAAEGITELSGKPTSTGRAQGTVRIVPTASSSNELCEGEVLVCAMTSPEYVPAMKRAAAIVTDEGGLLSHAAIMSREFGKPCVVSTKKATKALRTGDLVEVDGDQGRVRILERAVPEAHGNT